jgi:hypothetical protein
MRDFTFLAQDVLVELIIVLQRDEDFLEKFTLYTGFSTKMVKDALMQLEMGNTK